MSLEKEWRCPWCEQRFPESVRVSEVIEHFTGKCSGGIDFDPEDKELECQYWDYFIHLLEKVDKIES